MNKSYQYQHALTTDVVLFFVKAGRYIIQCRNETISLLNILHIEEK